MFGKFSEFGRLPSCSKRNNKKNGSFEDQKATNPSHTNDLLVAHLLQSQIQSLLPANVMSPLFVTNSWEFVVSLTQMVSKNGCKLGILIHDIPGAEIFQPSLAFLKDLCPICRTYYGSKPQNFFYHEVLLTLSCNFGGRFWS